MKPPLIFLCMVICGLAGWHFGSNQRLVRQRPIAAAATAASPQPAASGDAKAQTHPKDVQARRDRLRAEVGPTHRQELAARVYAEFQDLASDEFAPAIATLASDPDGCGGEAAVLLAGLWAERDLPAARTWMLGLNSNQQFFAGSILDTWARLDPAGMFDWLEAHGKELHADLAGCSIAKAAFLLDPNEAFGVMDRLRLDEAGLGWRREIYKLLAERDPADAVLRALSEPNETRRSNVVKATVGAWGRRDPTAARAWAEQLADPILADSALATIGDAVSLGNPSLGAQFLTTIPQTDKVRETLRQTASWWALCDLSAALNWAAALDDEPLRRSMLNTIRAQPKPKELERAIAELPAGQRTRAEQWWRESRAAVNTGNQDKSDSR